MGGDGLRERREDRNSNSNTNSNSKTLFYKHCSLGFSQIPV